jgi:plasmid stabilization system protein ParE
MARVLKRAAARRDLIQQWVWYAENASIEVADRFLRAADKTLDLFSTQPESVALRSSLGSPSCRTCANFQSPMGLGRFSSSTFLCRTGLT